MRHSLPIYTLLFNRLCKKRFISFILKIYLWSWLSRSLAKCCWILRVKRVSHWLLYLIYWKVHIIKWQREKCNNSFNKVLEETDTTIEINSDRTRRSDTKNTIHRSVRNRQDHSVLFSIWCIIFAEFFFRFFRVFVHFPV